jgi:hypothetical protein
MNAYTADIIAEDIHRVRHAECRDGDIFWRGSDDWFRPMSIHIAERLLPNLTGEISHLAPDLKAAIEEAKSYVHA